MEKRWSELTPEQKREERLKNYISPPDAKFRDARAERLYNERVTRMLDAFMCKEPDRVPVNLPVGNYPAYYAGWNLKKVMYDYRALRESWTRFMNDFYEDMDSFMGPGFVWSGTVLELLKYKPYKWPGDGLDDNVNTYQFVEEAYMQADEYDDLMKDPSDFSFRVLAPRTICAAEELKNFPPLNSIMGMTMVMAFPFSRPEMRAAFQALIDAGEEMEKWQKELRVFNMDMAAAGFPVGMGGLAVAPFDVIGDFLRGTRGTVIDMYRQPEKILEAIDMITEQTIPRLINSVNASGGFSVAFPLHKGDDTFMSNKQFEKFYWPSLRKVILALIDEGIMVSLFAEGQYNQRLEYIKDFPKGWVMWQFDKTDMVNAKKIVGSTCCIAGNVPSSLVSTRTAKEVKEYCRKLIEACAPGGGYVLSGGAAVNEVKNPENLRVFMEAAMEYGTYK
jgi:hypothetical protein